MSENQLLSLPVTILSQQSDQGNYASREMTETFSEYAGRPEIPDEVIQELAMLYKQMNGQFSPSAIREANAGMCAFCEFLVANGGGLESIDDFTSADAARFYDFCQTAFPAGWNQRYGSLRSRFNTVVDVNWPRMPSEPKNTEGFSVEGSADIRDGLKIEVDRIRSKTGRLERDLKNGKVLDFNSSTKFLHAKDIPGLMTATRADIIKTIRHYLPHYPLDKGDVNQPPASMNPGEWLHYQIARCSKTSGGTVTEILRKLFSSVEQLYDYYFPTSYDGNCIIMYWILLTGWNLQVVESVGTDELNIRFKRNHLMNAWSKDHVIIRGKKIRSQPKGKPKVFTHISDKNDKYGLFNVLSDFYKLTETIRFGDNPLAERCIIITVSMITKGPVMFGPGAKQPDYVSRAQNSNKSDTCTQRFFKNHEIYDDAESTDPQVRIEGATWSQLRTSYETILEAMGLPLYVRQRLMGHESIDTTMFPYGSDRHATKIQLDKLRETLSEIHKDYSIAKYFQGAFLTPQNDPRRHESSKQKVVSILQTDWRDNVIMVCENCRKPDWPGHQFYVKDGAECKCLGKCLLCSQCLIGRETLPYLAQWDMDIHDYFAEEGDWDSDLSFLELREAIKEAFDLWSQENDPDDVKRAKATAMRSDFLRIPLDIWNIGTGTYGD